jgi:hypothetical protein
VRRTAEKIENSLNDAINTNDWANLLVKLMEAHDEFDAVALAGLYCHDARTAAELGRNYCNWLNAYAKDKDLNTCIIRATEARAQAHLMKESAAACLAAARSQQPAPAETFSPADIIRFNADIIRHDLADGQASGDFHILAQKLEHAERVFRDTETLARTLVACERVRESAGEGIRWCMSALTSREWPAAMNFLAKALQEAERLQTVAGSCR